MRRLMHVLHHRGPANDRGAVGVLVGVLVSAGVLFGFAALVIDVGQIYGERAYLQNGADAGALAVAQACASKQLDCSTLLGAENTAKRYADDNATNDGVSALDSDFSFPVCGNDDLGLLPPCSESSGAITDCPSAPPSDAEYVDVHTATLTSGGSSLLPPVFARTILGNADYDGKKVRACARAQWGPPATADTIAVTISTCEWKQATSDGTVYAPYPLDPDPITDPVFYGPFDRVLRLHDPQEDSSTAGDDGSCQDKNAVDGPGQFGWVDDPDATCSVFIDGGTYSSGTGAPASNACKDLLHKAWTEHTPVFIPLYSEVTGTGTNGTYTFDGFAAFIVTGYHLPGFKESDWANPSNDCKGPEKCINGFFVDTTMPSTGTIGGPDRGLDIVVLTG